MKKIKCLVAIALVTFLMGCGNNSSSTNTSKDTKNNQQDTTKVVSTEGTSGVNENNKEVATSSNEVENNEISNNIISDKMESKKEDYLKSCTELEEYLETALVEKYAGTTADMIEASKIAYENWDNLLNGIYEVLIDQLPAEEMEAVRQEELNWINERDTKAKEAAAKYEGGTMEPLEYESTRVSLTKERCYELINNYMK